jgi:hypothetical protein
MSFFDASVILAQDRNHQILELAVACPTAYAWPLIARILVLTSLGIGGFAGAWLMARFVFGIHVVIFHPALFVHHARPYRPFGSGDGTHHHGCLLSDSNNKNIPECH